MRIKWGDRGNRSSARVQSGELRRKLSASHVSSSFPHFLTIFPPVFFISFSPLYLIFPCSNGFNNEAWKWICSQHKQYHPVPLLTWTLPAWPFFSWCGCLSWPLEGWVSATIKYQGETDEATIDSSSWVPSPCEGNPVGTVGTEALFERIYSGRKCRRQLCVSHLFLTELPPLPHPPPSSPLTCATITATSHKITGQSIFPQASVSHRLVGGGEPSLPIMEGKNKQWDPCRNGVGRRPEILESWRMEYKWGLQNDQNLILSNCENVQKLFYKGILWPAASWEWDQISSHIKCFLSDLKNTQGSLFPLAETPQLNRCHQEE